MLTPEQIEIIKNSFKYNEDLKHKTLYRVKFDGKFLVTASKKTLWSGINPAKLAILNHLECLSGYNKKIDYYKCKEIREELEKLGRIEYIPV